MLETPKRYKSQKYNKNIMDIQKFKHYFLNLILIWAVVLFYKTNNYYINFLRPQTQTTILYLALTYTIAGFFYYLFSKKEQTSSKGFLIYSIFFTILFAIKLVSFFLKGEFFSFLL